MKLNYAVQFSEDGFGDITSMQFIDTRTSRLYHLTGCLRGRVVSNARAGQIIEGVIIGAVFFDAETKEPAKPDLKHLAPTKVRTFGQPEIDAEMKVHYLIFKTEDSIVKLSDKVIAKPIMIKASEKAPIAIWKCEEDGQCFETMGDLEDHKYFLIYRESGVRYFGKKGNVLEDEKFDFAEREYGVYAGSEQDLEIIESLGTRFGTPVPWEVRGDTERETGYFVYDEKEGAWFDESRIEGLCKLLKKIKESSGPDVGKN